MATIKSFTSLEQSKKLSEILPIESADMHYWKRTWKENDYAISVGHSKEWQKGFESKFIEYIPCWSLAVLINALPYPQLSKDKLGSGKEGWMVSVYPDNCRYDSCWHDNQIDCCYEMIIRLHELNLL